MTLTKFIEGREVKVGDPWFDDGNIVLVTDEDATAFRLHRGVLSRHSDMFKDMFEVGQIPENGDTDNQVVVMYDRPADLSSLVKALYDGVTSNQEDLEDFFQLAGVLRLATKYCAQRIRTHAIRHLLAVWPRTLEGHDSFTIKATTAPSINDLNYPYIHPLHVLNLAREADVEVLVPAALYFLSMYSLQSILSADHPKLEIKHPSRPSSSLSPSDLQLYTLMYQYRLDCGLEFIRKTCMKWVAPSSTRTCNEAECRSAFSKLVARLQRSWNPRTGPIYFMLQATWETTTMEATLCKSCQKGFAAEVEDLRASTWDNLPKVSGIAPWADLVDRDLTN